MYNICYNFFTNILIIVLKSQNRKKKFVKHWFFKFDFFSNWNDNTNILYNVILLYQQIQIYLFFVKISNLFRYFITFLLFKKLIMTQVKFDRYNFYVKNFTLKNFRCQKLSISQKEFATNHSIFLIICNVISKIVIKTITLFSSKIFSILINVNSCHLLNINQNLWIIYF